MLGLKKVCVAALGSMLFASQCLAAAPVNMTRTAAFGQPAPINAEPLGSCSRFGCNGCEWKIVDGIFWCWRN